jgi:dimethylglycine dehydrogenase
MVGFITSGGHGHTIGKSLAMALVSPEAATIGSELSVHIVGAERKAHVIASSPYDPMGKAMRA